MREETCERVACPRHPAPRPITVHRETTDVWHVRGRTVRTVYGLLYAPASPVVMPVVRTPCALRVACCGRGAYGAAVGGTVRVRELLVTLPRRLVSARLESRRGYRIGARRAHRRPGTGE